MSILIESFKDNAVEMSQKSEQKGRKERENMKKQDQAKGFDVDKRKKERELSHQVLGHIFQNWTKEFTSKEPSIKVSLDISENFEATVLQRLQKDMQS